MKEILAAIRSALARIATFTVKMVYVGGRWIAQLVRNAPHSDPVAEAMADAAGVDGAEDITPLRALAGHLAQGTALTADLAQGVPPKQVEWLAAMTRAELCKVLLAQDGDIRAHLRGSESIKGIVPYDAEAIRQVAKARASRPKLRPTRRTLRAVLAEAEAREKGEPKPPIMAASM